jgi:glycosyltransferase involved in cell wall biosynthesis
VLIGIDCSAAAKPERTGVARYCASLVDELPHVLGDRDRVVLLHRLSRFRRQRWFVRIADPRFSFAWLNDRGFRWAPAGLDVVHGPDVRIPGIPCKAAVSTVHDLSAIDMPGIAGDEFRRRKLTALNRVAARAAAILCVSDFTQEAFLARYPEAAGRTRVIPLGIAQHFRQVAEREVREMRAARGLSSPYLLFVGQVSARKNLRPLLEAFARLHAADPRLDLDLVFAGPVQTGGAEIVAGAQSSPVADRIRLLGFTGDGDLPTLYTGAAAFIFPGKAEGFGMPSLEAMACGCPVVAARAAANVSTVGDAGLLFAPDDPDDLAAKIRRVLAPGGERAALIERGRRRAAEFTWRETARRTIAAYREVAPSSAARVVVGPSRRPVPPREISRESAAPTPSSQTPSSPTPPPARVFAPHEASHGEGTSA